LILSIHIAENAVTTIMTTVLLCFKGFFSRLSRKFLGGLAAHLFMAGSRLSRNFRGRRSACYKSWPAGRPAKSAA